MKPIAFVIPWYGENIPGGAESECRSIVHGLSRKNVDVEVLTTCVKEFSSDWSLNFHKDGTTTENEIVVRRFKVRKRNTQEFDRVNYKLMNNMPISLEEEEKFFNEMIYSQSLLNYISENKEKYHCFVFIPYMFGTTYWGVRACSEKAVLIPCLHDESYAYMRLMKKMFCMAKGWIFHAEPEYELANRIYGNMDNIKQGVMGEIIANNNAYDKHRFINKYNLNKPFILYAGRKDRGKNVDLLIEYFGRLIRTNSIDLDLVLIGGGSIEIPEDITGCVHDIGFVSKQDKFDAYSAALFLCQPSTMESFSLVIMESWLAGRPVLVHNKCDVTKHFARKSNGGLYFDNYEEFAESTRFLISQKNIADKMGLQGKHYVSKNFFEDIVVDKYIEFFVQLNKEP